jgi:serine protease Do
VLTPPEERAAPLLVEEEVQRRGQTQVFRGLQEIGPRVVEYSVAIPRVEQPPSRVVLDFLPPAATPFAPAGFGLVVSGNTVLTHVSALEGRSLVQLQTPDGTLAKADASAYDPTTGLVLLTVAGDRALAPAPAAGARPKAGALAAAVAHWAGGELVTPLFVTSVDSEEYTTSIGAVPILAGTPIYNLDGEVLAISAGSARGGAAVPVVEALVRLRERTETGRGRPASLGIALQPLVGGLEHTFGDLGALVSDVMGEGPAARAGVLPGDVLVAVGETGVESGEAAQQAIGVLEVGAKPASASDAARASRSSI